MSGHAAALRSLLGLALAVAGGLVECVALLRARLRWRGQRAGGRSA